MGVYSKELTSAMANLGADLEGRSPSTSTQPVGNIPTGTSSYLRAIIGANDETLYGQKTREPTNRHNAYFSPGELSNLASGLFSSDCNNVHNPSVFPLLTQNVPCKVQPPFNWGSNAPTTPSGYYPHLTAAKP